MLKQEVTGHFCIYSNKRGKLADFTNLITDVGIDSLITTGLSSNHGVILGNGTTAPVVTNTTMESPVVASNLQSPRFSSGSNVLSVEPYGTFYRRGIRFNEGTAVGNFSEIGFAYWPSTVGVDKPYTLIARSLIKNAEGIPTTLTILSDEILDVVYTLYFYTNHGDVSGTVVLGGNIGGTYAWTLRPAYLTTYATGIYNNNGWNGSYAFMYPNPYGSHASASGMGTMTNGLTGAVTTAAAPEATVNNYVAGSFTVPFLFRIPTSTANLEGGIKSISFRMGKGHYQMEFTPAIPKTDLDSVLLNFQFTVARGA